MPAVSTTHRLLTPSDPNKLRWQERALCRTEGDPELWHPVGSSGPAIDQVNAAKAVCVRCPVVMQCRTWALDSLEYGVAGGLTEEERRGVRRKRAAARKSVTAS